MHKQHLIAYNKKWWHFFLDRTGSLCFRIKEHQKWNMHEILLREILEDFTVLPLGEQLHIVCQDRRGNILYLQYAEEKWQKTTVYESGGEDGYPKHFHLTAVAGYLNLFYILHYKQRPMLVHQILGMGGTNVVDHITLSESPFCVVSHIGTSLSVFYVNSDGKSGYRKFLWSKKAFQPFVPLSIENGGQLSSLFVLPNRSEGYRLCGINRISEVNTICFAHADNSGSLSALTTAYLDAEETAVPVLLDDGKKLYLIWLDGSQVYYAVSGDDGASWSKAMRFIKGEYLPPVLYRIAASRYQLACYGYENDRDVNLFVLSSLLSQTPSGDPAPVRGAEPAGRDVERFAQESVPYTRYQLNEPAQDKNYVTVSALYTELNALKTSMNGITQVMPAMKKALDAVGGIEAIIRRQAEHMSQLEQRIYQLENHFFMRQQQETESETTMPEDDTPAPEAAGSE